MFSFDIVPFALAKNWITNLYSALKHISSERKDELNEIANVFGDAEGLAEFYIEPDCQQFNPAEADSEGSSYFVREPIFDRIAAYLSTEPRNTRRHLFILSDAGMGKTSLLVMLKLAHLTSFWPRGYDCQLLKLGHDTVEALSKISNQKDTVLLLDALDEDPLAWANREHRIYEILSKTENFRRVIITCRNQFIDQRSEPFHRPGCIEISGYICPVIFNSLFTDEQVVKYLKKRYPTMIGNAAWEVRVAQIISSMGFLKMRPMLLAHIDDLLDSSETNWNEFTIYRALITVWLMREQKKILQVEGRSPTIDELNRACRYLALQINTKNRSYLTSDEMASRSIAFAAISTMSVRQLGVRSLLNRDNQGNFKFSHYSILEFLVLDSLLAGDMKDLSSNIQQTSLMTIFARAWILDNNHTNPQLSRLRKIDLAEVNFSGRDLSGINLSHFDCSNANFAGATLTSARFDGASLSGANFRNATLDQASFEAADLHGADFASADLTNASVVNANISTANFYSAILDGANLTTTKFHGADFHDVHLGNDGRIPIPIRELIEKARNG